MAKIDFIEFSSTGMRFKTVSVARYIDSIAIPTIIANFGLNTPLVYEFRNMCENFLENGISKEGIKDKLKECNERIGSISDDDKWYDAYATRIEFYNALLK